MIKIGKLVCLSVAFCAVNAFADTISCPTPQQYQCALNSAGKYVWHFTSTVVNPLYWTLPDVSCGGIIDTVGSLASVYTRAQGAQPQSSGYTCYYNSTVYDKYMPQPVYGKDWGSVTFTDPTEWKLIGGAGYECSPASDTDCSLTY